MSCLLAYSCYSIPAPLLQHHGGVPVPDTGYPEAVHN